MANESPTTWLRNFLDGFIERRPIFARGIQIGYWTPSNNICGGSAEIYNSYVAGGYPTIHPSEWITKDDLWRDVPVTDYCIAHNRVPTWATKAPSGTVTAQTPAGTAAVYTQKSDGSFVAGGTVGDALSANFMGVPIVPVALGGVALLLLLRK